MTSGTCFDENLTDFAVELTPCKNIPQDIVARTPDAAKSPPATFVRFLCAVDPPKHPQASDGTVASEKSGKTPF